MIIIFNKSGNTHTCDQHVYCPDQHTNDPDASSWTYQPRGCHPPISSAGYDYVLHSGGCHSTPTVCHFVLHPKPRLNKACQLYTPSEKLHPPLICRTCSGEGDENGVCHGVLYVGNE